MPNMRQPDRKRRKPADQSSRSDTPYTMQLPDGRTVCVEVPGRWVTRDRSGQVAFLPEAVAFLDRVRAVFMSAALDRSPSPGHIARLREALGMTQDQFGDQIGVDKMTVSRWERGTMHPSARALQQIEKLRKQSIRRGVAI